CVLGIATILLDTGKIRAVHSILVRVLFMPNDNAKILAAILEGADFDAVDAALTPEKASARRRAPKPQPAPDPLAEGMEEDTEVEEAKPKEEAEENPKKVVHSPRALQLAEFYGLNPK